MNDHAPKNITADRSAKIMTISWSDGVDSKLHFSLLRAACPCAECRGGHENMRSTPDPDVFLIPLKDVRENEIVDVKGVGNYGLTIAWADGHKYGIYTWDYLRALGDGASPGAKAKN